MQEIRTDNTLLDIITCLRRHVLGMLLVFVLVLAVAAINILRKTPIFEAQSRLLIKYGREYVYHSVEGKQLGDTSPAYTYNENIIINTELEILKSPELAEEVINTLGVGKIFPALETNVKDKDKVLPLAVNRFGAGLNVYHVKGSKVIGVAWQHDVPEVTAEVVGVLVDRFKERHLDIYKNPQRIFLEKQVTDFRKQLQDAEDAKKIFMQEHNIVNLEEEQKSLIFNYNKLQTFSIRENNSLVGLEESIKILEGAIDQVPEVSVLHEEEGRGNSSNIVGGKMLDLRLTEYDMLKKYPKESRKVREIEEKISIAKHFLQEQEANWHSNVVKSKDGLYKKLENQIITTNSSYASQQKKNVKLKEELDKMHERLLNLSGLDIDINRFNRNIKEKETIYWNFVKKLEASRLQDAMDREKMVNVVVIEKPRVPLRPVKPRKKIMLLVGLALAFACSLFYCLVAEYVTIRKQVRA